MRLVGLRLSHFGLERWLKLEHWGQRRTMPDNGKLPGGRGNVGVDRRAAVRRGQVYTTIHGNRWCFYGL